MKPVIHHRPYLLLSVLLAGSAVGFGQDVPATPAFKILDTASHLANKGRLKDALRIVNFVQATPGLTDRESAECQTLLAEFESLAIKFYASKSLGQEAPMLRGEASVGAVRFGARMVVVSNGPSPVLSDVGLTGSDQAAEGQATEDRMRAGVAEADRNQLKPFEWVAIDSGGTRLAKAGEGQGAELADWPAIAEVPRMLPSSPVLRSVFDEAEAVPPVQGLFPEGLHLSSDSLASASDEPVLVGAGPGASPPALPCATRVIASADSLVVSQAVGGSRDRQPAVICGDSIFDFRWALLIACVLLGSLPASVIRFTVMVHNRFFSRTAGGFREGDVLPDSGSSAVAKVESIFSQIVEENQRLQR